MFNLKARFILSLAAVIGYASVNYLYLPGDRTFPDEKTYIGSAITLAETGEFSTAGFRQWQMPGTVFVYSIFYRFTGSQEGLIYVVRAFQSLALLVTGFLAANIAYAIFENKCCYFFTLSIILFYPFFVFFQGLLLSETLFISALVASLWLFYRWASGGFRLGYVFVLTILGFAVTTYIRPTLTFFPPVLMATGYLFRKRDVRRSVKVFILALSLFCVLLSPWWVRSFHLFGRVIPFTTSSFMNMYVGNNPKNTTGGADWSKDAALKLYSAEEVSELEYMELYRRETRRFISENPGGFLNLCWLRFKRFWNIVPNAEPYDRGLYKYVSMLSFGPILLLTIVSLCFSARFWINLVPVYLIVIYFTVIHCATIASLRYRMPIEPFLIILASLGFCQILRLIGVSKHD